MTTPLPRSRAALVRGGGRDRRPALRARAVRRGSRARGAWPVSTAFGDTAVGTIESAADEATARADAYAGFREALALRYAQAYDGNPMRLAAAPMRSPG